MKSKTRSTTNEPETSNCHNTRIFRIKTDGVTHRVCKTMFLNTLGVKRRKIEVVLSSEPETVAVGIGAITPKRRNHNPSRGFKWTERDQELLVDLFHVIPKARSHYCRKDTNKIYLAKVVPTLAKLYEISVRMCFEASAIHCKN